MTDTDKSKCRSGCERQDCGSYAACLRNSRIQIGNLK